MKKTFKIFSLSLLLSKLLFASSFFNASFTPEMAVHNKSETIEGISVAIYSENPQHAFALGFVNGSAQESSGFTMSFVNYGESYAGVQWAIVNHYKKDSTGWMSGIVNQAMGDFVGFQSALINYAANLKGLQFGVLNMAARAEGGLQIGLVNIIEDNQFWFDEAPKQLAPAMALLNWRF